MMQRFGLSRAMKLFLKLFRMDAENVNELGDRALGSILGGRMDYTGPLEDAAILAGDKSKLDSAMKKTMTVKYYSEGVRSVLKQLREGYKLLPAEEQSERKW